ncbi:hypothetical protein ACFSRY_19110, partial [Pontibacter locisalis]
DEAWQENKQGLLQPDLEEDIPHLSAKSSLSGKVKIRKIQLKFLTFKTVPYPQRFDSSGSVNSILKPKA